MLEDSAGAGGAPIDRYVVQEYLAEGGMGAIYLGQKLGAGGFQKQVVLKQLLPEFTQQPEFIELFLREARLSATLDHANIIHTIDLVTAGAEYFIVMEFLDGADLRTMLKRAKMRKKRLAPSAGIFVAREILSALAYAHSKLSLDGKPLRLIHRDISPSNILISRQGEVKLTDFGIAKASTHNSVFYRVKGKIGYMSPEQARSEPLDARSDLYSLAVCFYEMITGERLFVHAGLTTSAEEMYKQPVPLLSRKVQGLPSELDKVMLKALSVDRDHRYQTAGEFQEALLRVAHRQGLMTSVPELARHLSDVAGDPGLWRELDDADQGPGEGTEVYDEVEGGTVRLSSDELEDERSDPQMLSAIFDLDEVVNEDARRQRRALTSVTHLGELKGIELTSMVPVADGPGEGAEPLVDLDAFGTIEAGNPARGPDPSSEFDGAAAAVARASRREAAVRRRAATEQSDERELDEVATSLSPSFNPWIIVVLVFLLGAGIAIGIGLSGPELEPTTTEKR